MMTYDPCTPWSTAPAFQILNARMHAILLTLTIPLKERYHVRLFNFTNVPSRQVDEEGNVRNMANNVSKHEHLSLR